MVNYKQEILERIELGNETGLAHLIQNSMTVRRMLNGMTLIEPRVEFKLQTFFQGLKPILNEIPKKESTRKAIEIIQVTFDVFGFELSLEECAVLYELKELGKFRIKDDKLLADLETAWNDTPELRVGKAEFRQILKDLKNTKIIDLRRHAITLPDHLML